MVRIVLDPDEVNQQRVVTLTDGSVVELAHVPDGVLERIAAQLEMLRSAYAHAFDPADPDVRARWRSGVAELQDVAPLYVRVAALRRRARDPGRRHEDLDPEALLQGRTWTSSSGVIRELAALTPSHRRNLLAWLERHSDQLRSALVGAGLDEGRVTPADPWIAGTPLYRRLVALAAAETERERARDEARQVLRGVEYRRSGAWPDD